MNILRLLFYEQWGGIGVKPKNAEHAQRAPEAIPLLLQGGDEDWCKRKSFLFPGPLPLFSTSTRRR